jgi:hypothetical protein
MAESQIRFFRARVEQARAEGEEATLDHVRERCRRSEEAWAKLAARAERSERLRASEAKRKAEAIPMNNILEKTDFEQQERIED